MTRDPIARLSVRALLRRPTGTTDPVGGRPRAYEDAGTVWAELLPEGARFGEAADGDTALSRVRVRVRRPCAATPGWRVLVDGRDLLVRAAETDRLTIDLICEQELP